MDYMGQQFTEKILDEGDLQRREIAGVQKMCYLSFTPPLKANILETSLRIVMSLGYLSVCP